MSVLCFLKYILVYNLERRMWKNLALNVNMFVCVVIITTVFIFHFTRREMSLRLNI